MSSIKKVYEGVPSILLNASAAVPISAASLLPYTLAHAFSMI
jgi:hypothetical protein